MKAITKLKNFSVLLLILAMTLSCNNDDDDMPIFMPETITELAVATPDLSNLVAALQRAGLAETLDSEGSYTVFAPTNAAFSTFLSVNGFASLNDVPVDVLTQVLLNHVIIGEYPSTSLTTDYKSTLATQVETNLNLSMFIDTTDGVTLNGVSNVSIANIDATNGIIHIVDAVIGLPSLVDHAVANPMFSSLVAALGAADGGLVEVLNGNTPFTVLAPDNDAFATILDGEPLSSVPTDYLAQVLLNHVISGVVKSSDLGTAQAGYAKTNAAGPGDNPLSIYYNTTDGVRFNGVSSVTKPDVVAANGIIHAVDAVIDLPTIATFATSNAALSILVDALVYADTGSPTVPYIQTVSDETAGPLTVFAPTNDAFASLLTELNVGALTEIATGTVDAVLLQHIVVGNIQSSQLTSGTVNTLGGPVTVNATAFTITDANARVSNIITSLVDIQAINGVVHVIDKVIRP